MALGSFLVLSLQEGLLQAPDEPLSELHGREGRATQSFRGLLSPILVELPFLS